MAKNFKCISCRRPVELNKNTGGIASGPACIPCFFAAKMKYENGFTSVDEIPEPIKTMLFQMCQQAGNRWPDDMVAAFLVNFEKVPVMQRWWSEKRESNGPPTDAEMQIAREKALGRILR